MTITIEPGTVIKGYKGTEWDMKCLSHQFELGIEYRVEGPLLLCGNGFHFCRDVNNVPHFYGLFSHRIFEVEATVEYLQDDLKCCARSIKFVRELTVDEVCQVFNQYRDNIKQSILEGVMTCTSSFTVKLFRDLKNNVKRNDLDQLVNHSDVNVRYILASNGLFSEQLYQDSSYIVRCAVAQQGYKLEGLINDGDHIVRAAVAQQGYGLDTLITDQHPYVRHVARQQYKLDVLINESDCNVVNRVLSGETK